jgi:hypothetical protein
MSTTERIQDIIDTLEDAISYDDIDLVEEARKELVFLLDDLTSDFPVLPSDEDF